MSSEINHQSESEEIQPETIQQVKNILQNLATKTQTAISVEEAIDQLRDSLETALVKGYSYEELADLLQQEGIPISSSSLENYLASTKRRTPENKTFATPKLSDRQLQKIQELAQMYGIPYEVLLSKSLEDWANFPESDSDETTEYVLTKNAELYRRLA